jgi:hypothetical protein
MTEVDAMTIVLELARCNTIPEIITDPPLVEQRRKQIEACNIVKGIIEDFIVTVRRGSSDDQERFHRTRRAACHRET